VLLRINLKTPEVNNCRGCRTYMLTLSDSSMVRCRYLRFNYVAKCPCTNCIVKTMCDVDCDVFLSFTDPKDILIKWRSHERRQL